MNAGSAIFCYDANGNMTQKIDSSTTSYTYDAENRMTAVSGRPQLRLSMTAMVAIFAPPSAARGATA